jgi:hypothetical protein
MAVGVAVAVVVIVVVPLKVTATLDAVFVRGFVSLTVTVPPLTAVTWPDAAPKEPPANPPAGRLPVPAVPPPKPPNPPAGRLPVPGVPPGRPPKPRLQVPLVGWLTDTVVAVIGSPNGVAVDEVEAGLPNAEMQEPTVIAAAEVVVVWRMVVDEV